ncbi:putative glycosyltransferase [Tolypothrix tenuis PCC 7101]|uniref:Putative glycosyltransferase n=1 Tax=Tolypothrix tenuis PCC 7101 TaxID=231146 RepID=A0A1Z4N818_9CYAN|nr:glycosyltransferase [Aulosira sp. FACHB-113]BAZ01869.1 putative glycosyltransferase [Tolypothrix tenuis PCC 7101]BAZ74206.1 putative glycosyltransferase [Aulosira laxa NIES-50]
MSTNATLVDQISVCQVVASINENVGGPAYSVTNLAQALYQHNINSHLFTLDYQCHGKQILTTEVQVHSQKASKVAKYFRGFQPQASNYLFNLAAKDLDIIHNHGLWMFPNLYARQAAVINKINLVISPRGMLEPWSLNNSWYKKWLAWILYEKENLNCATAFHATSAEEVNSIRKLGYRQPIALIPNGINIPSLEEEFSRQILIDIFPKLADKKWLLFLSRVHPKKGLNHLIDVWQSLVNQFPDWHLIIAGPDLIGYQEKLELQVEQLNLKKKVTFTGMLSGQHKFSALSNADVFVLPTHSENFGIAVAESLAYGVPVITTKGAPWEDLQHYGCGWWIEDNQQALKVALVDAMQMSERQRQVMGLKGRDLVQAKYSWNSIAQEMANVYQWILGGGEPPTCVQLYNS